MREYLMYLISKYSYVAIFILIIVENVFPPIPSELILPFSGFVAKSANLNLFLLIIVSSIGSVFGALILYVMGLYFPISKISRILEGKIGHFFRINTEKINNSLNIYKDNGYKSVFICRLIPVLRSLISIPAGMAKMNIFIFVILTFLGSLIWNSVLILLGNLLGENAYYIVDIFLNNYKILCLIVIGIFIILKLIKHGKQI